MSSSTQCIFSGGCRLQTTDPSSLCHHHRRFSALTWDATGRMTQPRRLSTSIALLKSDPQYLRVYEAGKVAMDNRVDLIMVSGGVYKFEHSAGYGPAVIQDGDVECETFVDSDGDQCVRFNHPSSPADDNLHMQTAYRMREEMRSGPYANKYGIYTSIAEEYDDDAEVIAQLSVGKRVANSTVNLYNPSGHSDHDFRVKITPQAAPTEGMDISIRFKVSHDEASGLIYRQPDLTSVEGDVDAHGNGKVMNSVVNLLMNIDTFGVRSPDRQKLYMPVGWSDR